MSTFFIFGMNKAIDFISHAILLRKLEKYEIR